MKMRYVNKGKPQSYGARIKLTSSWRSSSSTRRQPWYPGEPWGPKMVWKYSENKGLNSFFAEAFFVSLSIRQCRRAKWIPKIKRARRNWWDYLLREQWWLNVNFDSSLMILQNENTFYGKSCWMASFAVQEIGFKRLQNFWLVKVLMSSHILCKMLSAKTCNAKKVFNTSRSNSLRQSIVLCSFIIRTEIFVAWSETKYYCAKRKRGNKYCKFNRNS